MFQLSNALVAFFGAKQSSSTIVDNFKVGYVVIHVVVVRFGNIYTLNLIRLVEYQIRRLKDYY